MKDIKRWVYIIRSLKGANKVAYILSTLVLFVVTIFILITIAFKLLNLVGITNISYVYNTPKIKLNPLSSAVILAIFVPGLIALQKGLKELSPHLKDEVDEENIKKFEKGTDIFKDGIEVLKKDGIYEFIRKDPLEIKKTFFYLFIFFGLMYLYNYL